MTPMVCVCMCVRGRGAHYSERSLNSCKQMQTTSPAHSVHLPSLTSVLAMFPQSLDSVENTDKQSMYKLV